MTPTDDLERRLREAVMGQVDYFPPLDGPTVQWRHIDGPLMRRRDGSLKWLSWRERFMFAWGFWTLEQIEARP